MVRPVVDPVDLGRRLARAVPGMTLWQRFVEVNRPGPPEHSISFRAASVMAVLVGIGACWSEGELSPTVSLFAVVATVVGNVVSYRRRADPWPGVKPVLAVCAVGGFVWFILTVTRTAPPRATSPPSSRPWPCCSPGSCRPTPSTSRPGAT